MEILIDDINVEVVRKSVRTLRLTVYPDGRVRLVVPWIATTSSAIQFLESRRDWLRQHYQKAVSRPKPAEAHYVSGEQFVLCGMPLTLRVEEVASGAQGVVKMEDTLVIYCRRGTDAEKRQRLLADFCRAHLAQYLRMRIDYYCALFGEDPVSFRIRDMRREWGSCMASKRSLMFNLQLARVPEPLIDYVIVHELCHLQVQNHSRRFWQLVETRMPDYKQRKAELNTYQT